MSPVAFLGTDDVAAHCLARLSADGLVSLVVTPPDRRRGRRGAPEPTPVRAAAERLGLPVLATPNANAPEPLMRIRAVAPKLLVVVSFGQFLSDALLAVPSVLPLNLHFSLLPRWRGAAPVQRAILAGDTTTGVCVQRMVRRMDAGPVLASLEEPLGPRDTSPAVRGRLAARGAALLADLVGRLLAGERPRETPQDEAGVTLAPRVAREEGRLDFAVSDAATLDRQVRALQPWPGCRATLRAAGRDVALLVREAFPEPGAAGAAGTVLAAGADGLVVAARTGALRITRLQRAGRAEVAVADFLNGTPVVPGDTLDGGSA